MNNEWGQSGKCLRVVSKHSLSLYLGLVENNSVFVWGQLIVDLIPRYGDLKVNTGNETSGQKATLLLSPRDCVTASLAPTFMTLQMISEDQFLFKTYIHTYAGTLYHVLLSEKVLSHKSVRRPCHLCQHQALSSTKTCQQTLRGEQCQQLYGQHRTLPLTTVKRNQQLQLPLTK